jgi:hypothetical protein
MKLISAQIVKFKNILDSTPVEIEPDVTCLVGKNESGKTAYLHALYRLRPARPNAVFNVQLQYPAWLEKRHRMEKTVAPVVVAEFELEPDDIAKLNTQFGEGVLKSPRLTLSKDYNNNLQYKFESDESAVVRNIIARMDLGYEASNALEGVTDFESLTSVFEGFKARTGDENEPFRAAAASLERATKEVLKESATLNDAVVAALDALTPQFFYFDDYANLPGTVKIRDLLQADPSKLDDEKLTALSLLKLAGAEDEYLLNPDYETRKRELENVASALTEEVLKYWTTNPDLRVEIDISQPQRARTKPARRPADGSGRNESAALRQPPSPFTAVRRPFYRFSLVFFIFGGVLEPSALWLG